MWIYYSLFILLMDTKDASSFWFYEWNNLSKLMFSFILAQYLEVELLVIGSGWRFNFTGNSQNTLRVYDFTFLPSIYENSSCSKSLLTFGVISFLNFSHSGGCVVYLIVVLIPFPSSDVEYFCMCLLAISVLDYFNIHLIESTGDF